MAREFKIGRNDPCPCGSGKKYKRCCGSVSSISGRMPEQIDLVKLNRAIAYKGRIGRQREEFCIRYTKHQQALNEEVMAELIKDAKSKGKTVSCHIECSFCCTEQIQASLQECEAIVYYLYSHEEALKAFTREFPAWHSEVSKHEDIIERLSQYFNEMNRCEFSEESMEAYVQEGTDYARLNLPCPFLQNGRCLIYEVRPYVCANLIVTTPTEWCNPTNPKWEEREFTIRRFGKGSVALPFYYDIPNSIESVVMPLMVYGILINGFWYLSDLTGLKSLKVEALNDPEVRAITQKLF